MELYQKVKMKPLYASALKWPSEMPTQEFIKLITQHFPSFSVMNWRDDPDQEIEKMIVLMDQRTGLTANIFEGLYLIVHPSGFWISNEFNYEMKWDELKVSDVDFKNIRDFADFAEIPIGRIMEINPVSNPEIKSIKGTCDKSSW